MTRLLTRLAIIGLVAGPALASGVDGSSVVPHSLSEPGLPYMALQESGAILPVAKQGRHFRGVALMDLDGDGYDELIHDAPEGQVVRRHTGTYSNVLQQWSLPVGFVGEPPFSHIHGYDGDGDGRHLVAILTRHDDGTHWVLWLKDGETGQTMGRTELPVIDGYREDGVWDGHFSIAGEIKQPGRERTALLLQAWAGHDVVGRGLLAVDPLAGEVLWRRPLDEALAFETTLIRDLDHDGCREILAIATGVNNLAGQHVQSAGDDSCRVLVFDDQGRLLWGKATGGPGTSGQLDCADVDGDGLDEIIVWGHTNPERRQLRIWRGDGRLLHVFEEETRYPLNMVVFPADEYGPLVIVSHEGGGLLNAIRWTGDSFVSESSVRTTASRLTISDLIPEHDGPELISVSNWGVEIYDRRLEKLAAVGSKQTRKYACNTRVWSVPGGRKVLLLEDGINRSTCFAPAPTDPSRILFAGGGVLLLGTAAFTVVRIRRRGRRRGVETDPTILKELRLQLLARLKKGGHEKVGALKSLRRVVWLLEAEVVLLRSEPCNPLMSDRLEGGIKDFLQDAVPRLHEINVLGGRVGLPLQLATSMQEILSEVESEMHRVIEAPPEVPRCHHVVKQLNEELELVLKRIRSNVLGHFRCDVGATFERVLSAQAKAIETGNVEVKRPRQERAIKAYVAIDVQDLEFVLDNLVGNAIQAMADSAERVLTLNWLRTNESVRILVEDTGHGIAPDDRVAVFEDGWSTKSEGGLGLAQSRRELELYGGRIEVDWSEAGRGTRFVVTLPGVPDESLVNANDAPGRVKADLRALRP